MKINCSKGNFKIVQIKKNQDELLVIGAWSDLVKCFESSRVFLIDRKESSFGIYVCKQECAEFMSKLIRDMDIYDREDLIINYPARKSTNLTA